MAPPTTRITLDELRKLAAEVFEVDIRAVTSPYHDAYVISIGALWSAPHGPHVEYRAIDLSLRALRDATGSSEGTHAFQVLFDVLEGILRRRSAARAARPARPAGELESPPSTVRPRLVPPFEPKFTEALPSEPPAKTEKDDEPSDK